ncbi:hypothetical protein BDR07DRAFT_1398217 [Suillus spraguei]|nr:hypothetical protein BDR07DRAFT_1398217 [Suillus spraguei]
MIWLTLSFEHVCDTVIINEQGQVLYKTNTPFRLLGAQTTTIQKIKPNGDHYHMQDQFEVLGEIEWHTFTSSKIRTGGTEVETKKFIPEKGLLGRTRWTALSLDLETSVVVLSRDDSSRMQVARFHRATLGIIGKSRKAMLEVSPEVAHMMDTVIMTFIYVEKLRRDQEDSPNGG